MVLFKATIGKTALIALKVFVLISVAGCSHSPLLEKYANSVKAIGKDHSFPEITREQVEGIPYASVGISIGDAQMALVLLAQYDHHDLVWVSSDKASFYTRYGRLVRTIGLPCELKSMRTPAGDPVAKGLHQLNSAGELYAFEMDMSPGNHQSVEVISSFRKVGEESITILEKDYPTIKVEEQLRVPAWGWQSKNIYWVDAADGHVWRTRQTYCPTLPSVQIDVLKRAAQPT